MYPYMEMRTLGSLLLWQRWDQFYQTLIWLGIIADHRFHINPVIMLQHSGPLAMHLMAA